MLYLYVDNFRGFFQTIIPIKNVNFLVGENSTGKTSIMALLNLISSPEFWIREDMNLQEYEFGDFNDIIPTITSKIKEFSIGFVEIDEKRKSNKKIKYHFFSFKEKIGIPLNSYYGKLSSDNCISIKRYKNSAYYKKTKGRYGTKLKDIDHCFSLLNDNRIKSDINEGQKIDKKIFFRNFLFPIIDFIETEDKEQKKFYRLPIPQLFSKSIVWLAPIRSKPQRIYSGYPHDYSPEGEHTPYILRIRKKSKKYSREFMSLIREFGRKSGLFKDIEIREFGSNPTDPFEIRIILYGASNFRLNSVGYGISQSLPVIVEIIDRPKNSWFAIQQPEVHLHPKAQASMGDFIYKMAAEGGKNFLIETHSDFIIDRFRLNYVNNVAHKTKAQVLFFENDENGNKVSVIDIKSNGEYSDDQPQTFRDFFIKENIKLLGIK